MDNLDSGTSQLVLSSRGLVVLVVALDVVGDSCGTAEISLMECI